MVSVVHIFAVSDALRLVLQLSAVVVPYIVLGAVIGFIWRGRSVCAALASIPASLALLAILELIADRLHWWWETPGEVFIWSFGPYFVLCLLPTLWSALAVSALCARRTQPSNHAMERTADRSAP